MDVRLHPLNEADQVKSTYLGLMSRSFSEEAVKRKEAAWDWLMATPHLTPEDANSFLVVRNKNDQAVATTMCWPQRIWANGEEIVVRAPSGTNADPDSRGAGLTMFRNYGNFYTYYSGIPADPAYEKLYRRMLGTVSVNLVNHFLPLAPGRVFARRKNLPGVLFAVPDWIYQSLIGARIALRKHKQYSIREIDRFDEQTTEFWERVKHGYDLVHVRDSRFMNWRYVDCPVKNYRRFALMRGDTVAGYVVTTVENMPDRRNGHITDVFCAHGDTDAYVALCDHAVDVLRAEGVDQVIARSTETCWSVPALKRAGFLFSRVGQKLLFGANSEEAIEPFKDIIDTYYFTRGDSDEDF